MSKRRLTSIALALVAGSTMLPAAAAESYTLWDNFNNATAMNPDRWSGLERTRIVKDGVARFTQRDIGTQISDDSSSAASWGMNIRDATDAIRQMRAVVTMTDYVVEGCPENTQRASVAQARIIGEFFNAGAGAPTSRIDDVGAVVRLVRQSNSSDGAGVIRVEGVVYRCLSSDCNSVTGLGSVDLGASALNTAETLRVEWEPELNRFNFQRGSNAKQSVTYEVGDSQPPFQLFRQIGTRTEVASCFSSARRSVSVSAKFDNFAVNNSAAP